MLAPHEPTLDPRVHYTANSLAAEYNVTVLGTVQVFERRPDGNYPDPPRYTTVRLRQGRRGVPFMARQWLRLWIGRRTQPAGWRSGLAAAALWLAFLLLGVAAGVAWLAGELLLLPVLILIACLNPALQRIRLSPYLSLTRAVVRRARLACQRLGALTQETKRGLAISLSLFRYTFRANARFWAYTREHGLRPDVVYCHDLYSLQTAVMLKRLYACTIVYDSHEYYPYCSQEWPVVFLTKWYERSLVGEVDVYLTVSPQLARELTRLYGVETIHVIPNVEPQPAQLPRPLGTEMDKLSAGRLKVLYQGTFAPGRGLEEVLDEWRAVDGSKAALFLRGPRSPVGDFLEARARTNDLLGKSVYFLPAVLERDLIPAAAEADVGLIPYKTDWPSYRFACPNKLSQYIHAGTAVVASRLPYVRDLIEKYDIGRTYDVAAPGSLVAAINEMADNPQFVRRCRAQARILSRTEYRWEEYHDKLLRLVSAARGVTAAAAPAGVLCAAV
jgi:glycosyltransferase involved in cell wall biosynthesis